MSFLAASVFNTVWNLGFTDIVTTDSLVASVEQEFVFEGSPLGPFAVICSQQQLAVVRNALLSLEAPDSKSTSPSSSSSSSSSSTTTTSASSSSSSSSSPLWFKLCFVPLGPDFPMERVFDRLSESTHIQAIRCRMPASGQPKVLQKLTKLAGLRALSLSNCQKDWSGLTQIRSLRTLSLRDSCCGLPDCSPFMKILSRQKWLPNLQEWRRVDSENQFRLVKIQRINRSDDQLWEEATAETHLEEIDAPFSQSLARALPRCRSVRSWTMDLPTRQEAITAISEALLRAPFVHSFAFGVDGTLDLSSLPLGSLKSLTLESVSLAVNSLSEALTKSKPKSLTYLEIFGASSGFASLARALLECPALTSFVVSVSTNGPDFLPVVQMLHRLPLVKLALNMRAYPDNLFESLMSFLSQSALQSLTLGKLNPKQHQLLADALPSLSFLQCLRFDTGGFDLCQHESAHLAFFSALKSSSLRSLTIAFSYFRVAALEACLNKIPDTRLTELWLITPTVYADGFDPFDPSYKQLTQKEIIAILNWNKRFPQIQDRFCLIHH
jgi:hypothetical protein